MGKSFPKKGEDQKTVGLAECGNDLEIWADAAGEERNCKRETRNAMYRNKLNKTLTVKVQT